MKLYESIYKKELKEGMKLEWEINPVNYNMNFKQAKEYMKSLKDDWTLPSIEQLQTLFYNKYQPFDYGYYWSSSLFNKETYSVINLKTGEITGLNPKEEAKVICCRLINSSYEDTIENLLIKHLKRNYSKTPVEINTIVSILVSVLNELEIRNITPSQGDRLIDKIRGYLNQNEKI